ncbi:hypothetical protein BgAZ_203490 [Babesia gibsoni]|uniref:Uncharacterized protein n=1 Tax=Babesia gibsoni TaxID=33632 RepID=A0AAD8LL10_BABGI|nr:hypothetical protein BgAZ_203490 [Babesia gibsoni]
MVYTKGQSGWSVEFTLASGSSSSKESTQSSGGGTQKSDDDIAITVQSGLHCGPAGRRTLIKWIEDNYKLRKKTQHANPGVLACRLWQESQGFSDPVAKAIVDLLKLNGVPANVTYKEVFESHLCKLLSTLIKKSADDKERLSTLAEKMIAMVQVTEIQPLLCDVLDTLDDIPPVVMSKLLENTSSAEHFFKIATVNVKRKIFVATPQKLFETIAPLIDNALFLLDLGILEDSTRNNPLYSGYMKDYQSIIDEIVELIGPPQTQTSRIIYFLVQQCIIVIFTKSVVMAKSAATTPNKNKDIDYDICYEYVSPQALKATVREGDETLEDYRQYARMSIGLLYNLDRNADETIKSVSEMRYSGCGFWNLSVIRHSITRTYQDKYRISHLEMQMFEPFLNLVQLVSCIIDKNSTELPTELLYKITKKTKEQKGQHLRIKNDMELYEVAFILSHPMVVSRILTHVVKHVQTKNMVLITQQSNIDDWLPLLALGLSSHCIAAYKFLLQADLYFQGNDCFCKSFLKPIEIVGKPVSITKLLSYVYPVDKHISTSGKDIPPFLETMLILKRRDKDSSQPESQPENGEQINFHELLVLYLPRINIEQLKAFISTCTSFYATIDNYNYESGDGKGRPEQLNSIYEESTNLLRNILDVLQEHSCDPKEYIKQMGSLLEGSSEGDMQKYNLGLMKKVYGKFKFLNSTLLGVISTTSSTTSMCMKVMAVKIVSECVTNSVARRIVKPALYEKLKWMNIVYLREPTDYVWLCLARIAFCEMNMAEFDSLTEVIANLTKQGHLCAFLPLYPLASRRGESHAIGKHIEGLHRVQKLVFDEKEHGFRLNKYMCACDYIKDQYNGTRT